MNFLHEIERYITKVEGLVLIGSMLATAIVIIIGLIILNV